jgi:hypothetical protein
MLISKSTTKLLFALLLLILAGSVPATAMGKTAFGVCFTSCDALDAACRSANGTPTACLDLLISATHTCIGLDITPSGDYGEACATEGGRIVAVGGATFDCVKTCL